MNIKIPFFALCLICGVSAQDSPTPRIKDSIVEQVKSMTAMIGAYDKKLKELGTALQTIEKRKDLSEEDRKKLENSIAAQQQAKEESLSIQIQLEQIKTSVGKQNEDIDGLKKNMELLTAQREKAATLKETVEQLEKMPETFKAFTRTVTSKQRGTEIVVELEATQEDKRIPLAGKPVEVSTQFKDGPLKSVERVVTDEFGIFIIKPPPIENLLRPTYLVFKFAGDPSHRASETRVQIK